MMRNIIVKWSRLAALLSGLALLALLAPGGLAQKEAMPVELRALVETERAFSRTSTEKGMKEAFLAYAADDGLLFRRTAVNAKEQWRQTTPAPTGLLTWQPAYADISRSGDLGYTTGPWEFRAKPTDKDAAGHGHFVTIWRKQADGTFKFALDIGTSHPAPVTPQNVLRYPAPSRRAGQAVKDIDAATAREALLGEERAFARAVVSKGLTKAFLSHADADVRIYRQNTFPTEGRETIRETPEGKAGVMTWRMAFSTSGSRMRLGTSTSSVSGATSIRTARRSEKRIC